MPLLTTDHAVVSWSSAKLTRMRFASDKDRGRSLLSCMKLFIRLGSSEGRGFVILLSPRADSDLPSINSCAQLAIDGCSDT